jgi:hypothetical protein
VSVHHMPRICRSLPVGYHQHARQTTTGAHLNAGAYMDLAPACACVAADVPQATQQAVNFCAPRGTAKDPAVPRLLRLVSAAARVIFKRQAAFERDVSPCDTPHTALAHWSPTCL